MWQLTGASDNNCHSSHVNEKFGEDAQVYQLVEGKLIITFFFLAFVAF